MRRIIAIFSFLIPLLVAFPANALEGGISGTYEYDGERINGVEVDLYKIADYNGSSFEFLPGFNPVDIGAMTNSQLGDYGRELAGIVQSPSAQTQTANGEYSFTGMNEGIYLVTFEDITIGDYTYSALPIVLTKPEPVPPEDEENTNTRDKIWFYIRITAILIVFETLTLFVIIKERKREDSNEQK